MSQPTLIQFRSSHYNEKARWALDYKRVPHTRRTLLPGFHARPLRALTGRTLVPALVRGGETIDDSTRIIAALEESHPEPALYPADPAERERALALEDWFDEEVGPPVRHAMFCLMVPHPQFVASLFAGGKNPLMRRAYGAMIGLRAGELTRAMKLSPETFEESAKAVDAGFARLESEVGASGYLVGSAFSVADLSAAALLSIAIFPEHHPHPPVIAPPPSVLEFWERFRGRPGGEWVSEIYRRHRGRSSAVAE